MNYIKSPQGIFTATVCLTLLFVFLLLRHDSPAQTVTTVGGRFQLLMPKEDTYIVFDTATARTWRFYQIGALAQRTWTEISPEWATK